MLGLRLAASPPQAVPQGGSADSQRKQLFALAATAIGVVFGDIGTSPLYALRECFSPVHGLPARPENVIGVVSLIFWSLSLIVCVKYLLVVLKADNRGEGGILALVALVGATLPAGSKRRRNLIAVLGIIGAALLFSDGVITPAISVLSAVEGLEMITSRTRPFVVPLAILVLLFLFPVQARGTAKIGRLFGPILTIWFVAIAALGLYSIADQPGILAAIHPGRALDFLFREGFLSFAILGSVFLSLTGAEVMYADLGHFGRKPIRLAWFGMVYPAIILNYLGQGARLIDDPSGVENLFYRLVPAWALIPTIVLATMATIIASQAVISGAFSITRQSVQLGFLPRIQIRHTSAEKIGQVYVPLVNGALMLGTIGLVLAFRESGGLANAYGIAVSVDMLITTCLMTYVAWKVWHAPLWVMVPLALLFLVVDSTFFLSNAAKIVSGGWIVVVFAILIFIMMKTWMDGRALFRAKMSAFRLAPEIFAASIKINPPYRVPGTAVYLTGDPKGVPKALLHNLKHNRVLHERTIILSVRTIESPTIDTEERIVVVPLDLGMWQVVVSFGFSETPDIPAALSLAPIPGFSPRALDTTYFVGRESLVISSKAGGMRAWRKRLFGFMFGNALSATDFFRLSPNSVMEVGSQTEL
jgi:KUP system potassium uptake protein